jgi:hypothetical protein
MLSTISRPTRLARAASSSCFSGMPNGDDRVTDELLHLAAVPRDRSTHRGVVSVVEPSEGLGVQPFTELGRADEVTDEDRHEPSRR